MSQGRSIRLFLVDGTPSGLMTAEIMNWTGHVVTGPRGKVPQLIKRSDCSRTGIYFLVGPPAEDSALPSVYIGESDNVAARLQHHSRTDDKGGKDFWEQVCLVTSKDQNLTKAHVKHLESLLMQTARDIGKCRLVNATAHAYDSLPESDLADMTFFMDQIRTVLPVLGFEFLRSPPTRSRPAMEPATDSTTSPRFVFTLERADIRAQAEEIDGDFVVLEGSETRLKWQGSEKGYSAHFEALCQQGILVEKDGKRIFTRDHAFKSPSAAAAVVACRNANGRTSWVVEGTGQTYADWQDALVMETPIATDDNYAQ